MTPTQIATRLRWTMVLAMLVGCDPATVEDAGAQDSGAVDSGAVDASPGCADFSGAYQTETLLDPCLAGTPIRYGALCVSQDGCTATVSGAHGELSGTAGADALMFETEGLVCTARRDGDQLTITCEDPLVSTSCSVSAEAAPSLDGVCCTADDDCEGADRCAPVTLSPSSPVPVVSACVDTGAGVLGGDCTTTGGVGDCGSGLTCTSGGLGDDAVECRATCRARGDCAGEEACVWYSLTAPSVGFCLPTCTLGGDDCGETATCDGQTTLAADGSLGDGLTCRGTGSVAPGATCARSTDCTDGHTCARPPGGELRCRPLCGPELACEDGAERCQLIGNVSAVSGACVPM
ncbi:MAG: hypothetical protein AB8I08_39650 [Sandaracinaceae bacterium]